MPSQHFSSQICLPLQCPWRSAKMDQVTWLPWGRHRGNVVTWRVPGTVSGVHPNITAMPTKTFCPLPWIWTIPNAVSNWKSLTKINKIDAPKAIFFVKNMIVPINTWLLPRWPVCQSNNHPEKSITTCDAAWAKKIPCESTFKQMGAKFQIFSSQVPKG